MLKAISRRGIAAGILTGLLVIGAYAHHGWSWAEADQIELKGTIREISMAPPHPTLQVESVADGMWHVELGNPRQTERSGFVEERPRSVTPSSFSATARSTRAKSE